jgi:ferredoxin-NADP reductase
MQLVAGLARNKRKAAVLAAWAAGTAAIAVWRASTYADAPTWLVPLARGSAAVVYVNCALVLLPMMRLALSRRAIGGALRVLLPVHKAIEAHAIAGTAIVVASAVHVAAYVGLLATAPDLFWGVARPAPLWTGVALTVLFAILAWGARMRTAGRFETFYATHFLSIPIGVLCLVHAPWFGVIVGLPLAAYLADRLIRLAWMTRPARVVSVTVDGRDLELVLDRPPSFAYHSGDYAFLCVPEISRLQWHPFSLINAPSDTGALAFRIRRAGSWTAALAAIAPGTRVHVDGPFASPCRDLHGCRRAIVVAGGIGITPFVSFLREVLATGRPPFDRLHLYWLERDEDSFRAFRPLLEQVRDRLGGALVVTLVAGSRAEGPIAWDDELARLRDDGMAGATLFFCGPPGLSTALRTATRRVGLAFRTESF